MNAETLAGLISVVQCSALFSWLRLLVLRFFATFSGDQTQYIFIYLFVHIIMQLKSCLLQIQRMLSFIVINRSLELTKQITYLQNQFCNCQHSLHPTSDDNIYEFLT